MPHAVVRAQTPEEREYARYLSEIEVRKRRAADLQAELETLKVALGRFEAEYHARVGFLFVELDRVRLNIDEYERRIARLHADPHADPAQVERDVQAEYASRREEVQAEEEETKRYERAFARERERPQLDAEAEDEIKRLYRELARRFHPDTARTEEERRRREPIMQRVNAAFRERDMSALRGIAHEGEVIDAQFEARSLGKKLIWAIREIARLDGIMADLDTQLAAVRASDTHALWTRQEAGEAVIEALEADLAADLGRDRDRLVELIATYRHLLGRRT